MQPVTFQTKQAYQYSDILVEKCGFLGRLYGQDDSKKKPAIILFSGSDSGMPGQNTIKEPFIQYLVNNGFTVLCLAYFGMEGLPSSLESIELEYFENAINWLQPQVKSINIIAQSRGAELALLLGIYFPSSINSLTAVSPSSVVCGGFPHPNRPAWCYQGRPISPFLSGLQPRLDLTEGEDLKACSSVHSNTQEDPYIITELFLQKISQLDAASCAIPVEKIKCPLLLLSGDKDDIWPSELFCKKIIHRLEQNISPIFHKHINYKDAGHGILTANNAPIFLRVGQFWCRQGGTPEANYLANLKSWQDIVTFLQQHNV